ncbi:hypothetical protein EKO04_000960 [Ascochyta lentis]|uniref:Uncharacterized protein n=1 Tax=Ascochyta lentis TaxID=205686 RepID=A0A8H7JEC8_9PLEO|nr:hypothetical protein EKO04_000960 [Ascochyta lentis]
MIAFTVAILTIVFVNEVNLEYCPHPELCPYLDNSGPSNSSEYYVDVSVGRLAFVSSLSSTISFALVASLMTLYGYVVAKQMLRASIQCNKKATLPSPYYMSTLIRILNAEIVPLWDTLSRFCQQPHRSYKGHSFGKQFTTPRVFRLCRAVFVLSLFSSLCIQIADTYLHVVIDATSVTRLLPELNVEHQLSKALAPWYFQDDGSYGTNHSKLFWSNALQFIAEDTLRSANTSLFTQTIHKIDSLVFNYTDAQGFASRTNTPSLFGKIDLNTSFPLNLTSQDSDAIFSNPWRWLGKTEIQSDKSDLTAPFLNSTQLLWAARFGPVFLLTCNTTVFDVSYSVINNQVSSLTTSKSNGSVAGMVSMHSLNSLSGMDVGRNQVVFEINENRTTPDAFIRNFELSMSKVMSAPLVVHTVPVSAGLVQRRATKVITKLPKLALWLLVASNLLFALLGLVLAVLALKATSPDTRQIQIRLSTAGLAAQLFNPRHAQCKVKDDSNLFKENWRDGQVANEVKVGVRRTSAGGVEFTKHEAVDKARPFDEEDTLVLRQTHTL